MKPFDAESKCSKCGGEDVHARYVADDEHRYASHRDCAISGDLDAKALEHVERYCRRCGYRWAEAALWREENRAAGWVQEKPEPVSIDRIIVKLDDLARHEIEHTLTPDELAIWSHAVVHGTGWSPEGTKP